MADESSLTLNGNPIGDLRVVDLRKELESRGLSKSGTKKELLERLKEELQQHKSAKCQGGGGGDSMQLENGENKTEVKVTREQGRGMMGGKRAKSGCNPQQQPAGVEDGGGGGSVAAAKKARHSTGAGTATGGAGAPERNIFEQLSLTTKSGNNGTMQECKVAVTAGNAGPVAADKATEQGGSDSDADNTSHTGNNISRKSRHDSGPQNHSTDVSQDRAAPKRSRRNTSSSRSRSRSNSRSSSSSRSRSRSKSPSKSRSRSRAKSRSTSRGSSESRSRSRSKSKSKSRAGTPKQTSMKGSASRSHSRSPAARRPSRSRSRTPPASKTTAKQKSPAKPSSTSPSPAKGRSRSRSYSRSRSRSNGRRSRSSSRSSRSSSSGSDVDLKSHKQRSTVTKPSVVAVAKETTSPNKEDSMYFTAPEDDKDEDENMDVQARDAKADSGLNKDSSTNVATIATNLEEQTDVTKKEFTAPAATVCRVDSNEGKPVRKRRWGSTRTVARKTSVNISTDSLKGLIPEIKPSAISSEPLPKLDSSSSESDCEQELRGQRKVVRKNSPEVKKQDDSSQEQKEEQEKNKGEMEDEATKKEGGNAKKEVMDEDKDEIELEDDSEADEKTMAAAESKKMMTVTLQRTVVQDVVAEVIVTEAAVEAAGASDAEEELLQEEGAGHAEHATEPSSSGGDTRTVTKRLEQTTHSTDSSDKRTVKKSGKEGIKVSHPRVAVTRKSPVIAVIADEPEAASKEPAPARNPVSCIVHVRNLVRPYTLGQLKEVLGKHGSIVEGQFWIDKIKSHCFVAFESAEQAGVCRRALHGARWPLSNPKVLDLDFATQIEMQRHTESELPPAQQQKLKEQDRQKEEMERKKKREAEREKEREERHKERLKRDKEREKENQEVIREVRVKERDADAPSRRQHVREWDRDKVRQSTSRSRSRERQTKGEGTHTRPTGDKNVADARRGGSKADRSKERKERKEKKAEEAEAPAKLLDDLFCKTKATPCIYWLPLTEEMMVRRDALRKEQKRLQLEEEAKQEDERRQWQRNALRQREERMRAEREQRARQRPRPSRRSHSRSRSRSQRRRR